MGVHKLASIAQVPMSVSNPICLKKASGLMSYLLRIVASRLEPNGQVIFIQPLRNKFRITTYDSDQLNSTQGSEASTIRRGNISDIGIVSHFSCQQTDARGTTDGNGAEVLVVSRSLRNNAFLGQW